MSEILLNPQAATPRTSLRSLLSAHTPPPELVLSKTPTDIPECLTDQEFVKLPGTKWFVAMVKVTPELAAKLLEANKRNRKIRPHVIQRYSATMASGNWRPSPEGLVFDHYGILANGQHRLLAIVNSGKTAELMVFTNVDPSVFKVLDRNAVRSFSDALNIPQKLSEVARIGVGIMISDARSRGMLDVEGDACADIFRDVHQELMGATTATAKIVSSAQVRTAACIRLLEGKDPQYVLDTYRALVHRKGEDLPRIGHVFNGQIMSGVASASGGRERQLDLLIRAMDVFDADRAEASHITVKNPAARLAKIRDILKSAIIN